MPWVRQSPCNHWRRLKKQLVVHVTSHITETEVDILPDYKKWRTLGQRRTCHDQLQIACRLQEQKLEPLYPFICMFDTWKRQYIKRNNLLRKLNKASCVSILQNFQTLKKKSKMFSPFHQVSLFCLHFETFTIFLTFSNIHLCINSSTHFSFQIVHLVWNKIRGNLGVNAGTIASTRGNSTWA